MKEGICLCILRNRQVQDMALLEKVQHRVTKMMKELERFSCEEWLRSCDCSAWSKEGLVESYQWIEKLEGRVQKELVIMMPSDRTRSNGHKIKHRRLSLNTRKHFFTVRAAKHWNRLLNKFWSSSSLKIFKSHIEQGILPQQRLPVAFSGWNNLGHLAPHKSLSVAC